MIVHNFQTAQRPNFTTATSAEWSFHGKVCAIIGNDFRVHFLDSSGSENLDFRLSRSQKAITMAWSASLNILAVGWGDGVITIWQDGASFESTSTKKSPILKVCWHPILPYLFSINKAGDITIWKFSGTSLEPELTAESSITPLYMNASPTKIPTAYIVSTDGEIFKFSSETNPPALQTTIPSQTKYISINNSGNSMITISGDNILTRFSIGDSFNKKAQVKIESGDKIMFTNIDDNTLCYAVNDSVFISDINATETTKLVAHKDDKIIALQYFSTTSEIAVITAEGRVCVWRAEPKKKYSVSRRLEAKQKLKIAYWSPYDKIALAISEDKSYSMIVIPALRCVSTRNVTIMQTDTCGISISGGYKHRFNMNIETLQASGAHLIVSSLNHAHVFSTSYNSLEPVSEFDISSPIVELLGDNVFVAHDDQLEVRNLNGEVKQVIQLECKGAVTHMTINGKFLAILTSHLELVLFDASRRVPRLQSQTQIAQRRRGLRVRQLGISRGGTCVTTTLDVFKKGMWIPAPMIYLHDPNSGETIQIEPENGIPIQHTWDYESAKLLCIQTPDKICPYILTGPLELQPMKPLPIQNDRLIYKFDTPRVFHCVDGSRSMTASVDCCVSSSIIPSLSLLDGLDSTSKRLLIEVYITCQNEEFDSDHLEKIISNITDDNTLRVCSKLLISLHHPEIAKAIIEKFEALSTTDEDEDKLSFMSHISRASYEEISNVCCPTDKFNQTATTYLKGLLQQSLNDPEGASKQFQMAGEKAVETLREAVYSGSLSPIFTCTNEPVIHRWLGRYYEYHKQYDIALTHYDICDDFQESIRLLCLTKQFDEASKRVSRTPQKGAICAYARYLIEHLSNASEEEKPGFQKQIVMLFEKAGQIGPAFQFAYENNMVNEVLRLSISAPRSLVTRAAKKFEESQEFHTAVTLWTRGGRIGKALQLCLDHNDHDLLEEVADSVKPGCDPATLEKCADLFIEAEQFDRAATFLALAHKFDKVKEICKEYSVSLPQSILDELVKTKAEPEILQRIAELCEQQGADLYAAQLFIKLGDHISAMRNIIASGDTERVVKLATLLKRKEAYILAADYISSTSPRESSPMFKVAIQFYKNANAFDKISEFLEKSAQAEIDDYHDYEKAAALMKKAHQTTAMSNMTKSRDQIVEVQLQKIRWIEMFIEAKNCLKSDPMKMQAICSELQQSSGVEKCLRIEDVYLLLVQYYVDQENFVHAHRILENMRMNGVDLKWHVSEEMLQQIYQGAGQTLKTTVEIEDDEEEIPDDIVEQMSDDF